MTFDQFMYRANVIFSYQPYKNGGIEFNIMAHFDLHR